MASIIKIKRSTSSGAPGSLKSGELAYSYGAGTQADGGARLYFGKGDDGAGNATEVVVAGGQYFADLLDHVHGTVTASSAIITDASNKIDQLNVDNLKLDGNTLSTTNTNGNLILSPNGTGAVNVDFSRVINVSTPTNPADAATKQYVDQQTHLDSTGATPGTFGSSSAIPVFRLAGSGLIESAGEVAVAGVTGVSFDSASGKLTVSTGTGTDFSDTIAIDHLTTDDLSEGNTNKYFTDERVDDRVGAILQGQNGIAISYNDENGLISISIDSSPDLGYDLSANTTDDLEEGVNNFYFTAARVATVIDGITTDSVSEGNTNQYFTTARAQEAARNALSISKVSGDGAVDYNSSTGAFSITFADSVTAGTGVTVTNGEIAIGQSVGTSDDVTFQDVNVSGNLVVSGNQTTVNTLTVTTTDPLINLADSNSTDVVDIGFVGKHDGNVYTGLFRDANDGAYYLFDGLTDHNDSSNTINRSGAGYSSANLVVGSITADNISGGYAGFDSDFTIAVSNISTDDIAEGTNQYYTNEKVFDAVATMIGNGSQTNITVTSTDGTDDLTFSVADAQANGSTKGVASFNATNFSDNGSGIISTADLTFGTGSGSAAATLGETVTISGSATAGVTTSGTGSTVTVSAVAATTTQRGTASFDSANFAVSSGAVSIVEIDGGTY